MQYQILKLLLSLSNVRQIFEGKPYELQRMSICLISIRFGFPRYFRMCAADFRQQIKMLRVVKKVIKEKNPNN